VVFELAPKLGSAGRRIHAAAHSTISSAAGAINLARS
jgi:hypothetical protein